MKTVFFLKAHVAGYTRSNGTYVPPHDDRRTKHVSFSDDMSAQMAWLNERANEHGFDDIDELFSRDAALFERLATRWRAEHPHLAKAIDQSALRAARRRGWSEPTPAQMAAGNYAKPRVRWQGLEIAIENPAGSVRRGKKPDGTAWQTQMRNDYGYVCRSEGVDGDEVDIFLGPDLDAPMVYVVHQRKVGDWDKYDEDKVMAGFPSEAAAREAFLANYDDPRFLGPITEMPVAEFVKKVRATYKKPAMIKALLFRNAPDRQAA